MVGSLVEGGATPIRLDWRLTPAGEGWRVLDVAVEGVSLLVTFRNEFAAVIERNGGQVEGLLRSCASAWPPSGPSSPAEADAAARFFDCSSNEERSRSRRNGRGRDRCRSWAWSRSASGS